VTTSGHPPPPGAILSAQRPRGRATPWHSPPHPPGRRAPRHPRRPPPAACSDLGRTRAADAGGGSAGTPPRAPVGPASGAAGPLLLAPPGDGQGTGALCPVAGCCASVPSAIGDAAGLRHLRRAPVLAEVPAALIAKLGLEGCRWCDSPLPTAGTKSGRSPLAAHEGACEANPRRWRRVDPLGPAPAGPAAPTAPGSATPPPLPSPGVCVELFVCDKRAWSRARRAFLSAVPPTADGWAPFVASPTRTHSSVPPGLRRAWRLFGADALSWVCRDPEQPLAWL